MAGPKAAAASEVAAGLLLLALELLRGLDSVCPVAKCALLKLFRCGSTDDPMLDCFRQRSARSSAAQDLAMSYASLLFVAFVVVPPSRLSFSLHWLCRISSFYFKDKN